MIATSFGAEAAFATRAGAAVGGDPVAALGVLALEAAILAGVVPLVMPASIDQLSHILAPVSECRNQSRRLAVDELAQKTDLKNRSGRSVARIPATPRFGEGFLALHSEGAQSQREGR
ncbi:hypothetical protein D3C81_1641270 [compost metagenome]